MKAILKKKEAEGFDLEEISVPEPKPKEVLVKVRAAAICGSDLKIYKWLPWCKKVVRSLPFIPGHECAGEVVKVGKEVKSVKAGDKVAAETHIPCGKCWQCRYNRPHTCQNMELFGHTVNGCFAEYSVIPEVSTRKIPDSISFDEGCLLEPMGIPFRAVERGEVKGDVVVVIGCGPIGQFAIAFSKIMGAEKIIGIDINKKRLSIAESMGATHLINPEKDSVVEKVKSLTKNCGGGAGIIIEASGNVKAARDAFDCLRVGGKFVILGHSEGPLAINPSVDIVFKETQIIGLFGRRIWDTWEKTEKLLTSGKLNVSPIITHRFPLAEFKRAFETALSGEGCKIFLIPD